MLYSRGTLPQHSCRSTHSSEIIPLQSSRNSLCCNHTIALIHHLSHASMIVLTLLERAPARANALVLVLALICSLSLVYTRARDCVCALSAHPPPRRARGQCLPADPDAAGKAIARDCAAGRQRVAGDRGAEQAAAARSRRLLCGAGGCGAEQAAAAPVKTA